MAQVAPAALQIQVTVPANAAPGTMFMAQAPDGRQVQVVVPAGVAPGAVLTVAVPANAGGAPQPENMLRRLMQEDVGKVWTGYNELCCGCISSWTTTSSQGPHAVTGTFTQTMSMKVKVCGCPCPAATSEITHAADCKTYSMAGANGGRADGILTAFDAATERATYSFSGQDKKGYRFSGTAVVDYREGTVTSKANGVTSSMTRQP